MGCCNSRPNVANPASQNPMASKNRFDANRYKAEAPKVSRFSANNYVTNAAAPSRFAANTYSQNSAKAVVQVPRNNEIIITHVESASTTAYVIDGGTPSHYSTPVYPAVPTMVAVNVAPTIYQAPGPSYNSQPNTSYSNNSEVNSGCNDPSAPTAPTAPTVPTVPTSPNAYSSE